jgi:hypothetical protein
MTVPANQDDGLSDLRYFAARLPDDPEDRVVAIDQKLAKNLQWEKALLALVDVLTREHEELAQAARTRIERPEDQRRRADLAEAIAQIQRGVHPNDGVIPRLSPLIGKPGRTETERTIARLREDRAALLARMAAAGAADVPHRLKPGKRHTHDGRPVQPGEVVMLTAGQARAWADKFEPVVTAELRVTESR